MSVAYGTPVNMAGDLVSAANTLVSTQDGITAHAGGTQAPAYPLQYAINRITTVGTIGDSVLLPTSQAGLEVTVINASSTSANVFPSTGEAINALGANAAFALAGGKTANFYCTTAGQWHSILSA